MDFVFLINELLMFVKMIFISFFFDVVNSNKLYQSKPMRIRKVTSIYTQNAQIKLNNNNYPGIRKLFLCVCVCCVPVRGRSCSRCKQNKATNTNYNCWYRRQTINPISQQIDRIQMIYSIQYEHTNILYDDDDNDDDDR